MTKIILIGEAWGEIPLTQGYTALVDLEDFDRINNYKWCVLIRPSGNVHAMRKNKFGWTIWMHHEVLGFKPKRGLCVDHQNRNGIDNRKNNLFVKTYRKNCLNSDRSDQASLIETHGNRFRVRPWIDGKRITLGSFVTREEAEQVVRRYRETQYHVGR